RGVAAGGEDYEKIFHLNFDEATENPAIAQLWGRDRIKDLMSQMFGYDTITGVEEVTETALTYQLLSQYTAFIAVSDDERVNPQEGSISMQVPVEMPEATDFMEMRSALPAAGGRIEKIARLMSLPEGESIIPQTARESQSFERERGISITPSNCYLEIVKVTGLDETTISDLQQYLQHFNLTEGLQGEIVLEFKIKRNRVIRVVLNEQNSTITQTALISRLIDFLRAWKPPQKSADRVVLTLRCR
ncbi:MAG: after-VIT domain-containing protein, partial [Cyanobacteria bacterium P01_D01_bin.50]